MAIVQKNQIIFRLIEPGAYKYYAFLDEHEEKLRRGHGILIAQLKNFDDILVAIPLRSQLKPKQKNHRYIYPFETYTDSDDGKEKLKGLDISKILFIQDEKHIDLDNNFNLEKTDRAYYIEKKEDIFRATSSYIQSYINYCNRDATTTKIKEIITLEKPPLFSTLDKGLQRFILNYQYSTLRNYHEKLDITKLTIQNLQDFFALYYK